MTVMPEAAASAQIASKSGGTPNSDTATIAAPVLTVIALNLLVWRALLRGLARRGRSEAVALVVIIALSLAVASWFAVAVLIFLWFIAFGVLGNGVV